MSKDYKIETIFKHAYRHSVEAKTTHAPYQILSMVPLGFIRDLEKDIAKEVQRREIEAVIKELESIEIYKNSVRWRIKELKSQLKELEK